VAGVGSRSHLFGPWIPYRTFQQPSRADKMRIDVPELSIRGRQPRSESMRSYQIVGRLVSNCAFPPDLTLSVILKTPCAREGHNNR
jgi:hypothetical protein